VAISQRAKRAYFVFKKVYFCSQYRGG